MPADNMGKTASHRSQFHSLLACPRVGVVEPTGYASGKLVADHRGRVLGASILAAEASMRTNAHSLPEGNFARNLLRRRLWLRVVPSRVDVFLTVNV